MSERPRIPMRPGAPEMREPARFHAAAPAGSYNGPGVGGTCESCRMVNRTRNQLGRKEWRCGIAVTVAQTDGRRAPNTVSPTRPACSRYKPNRGRRS